MAVTANVNDKVRRFIHLAKKDLRLEAWPETAWA
jgi:hypothetical protein